jgi:DNA mismatch repair protein MutS2
LDKILDEKGNIKDSASEHLFEVRRKIISKEKEINKRMAFIVKNAKEQGLIGEDANASVRNDSFVLPIQAVNKNKIRGLVHSISNTGQTFFIEPEEIRHLNNEIQELKAEERAEIIRILAKATSEIRSFAEILQEAYKFLGYIDFLRAKAKFAIKSRAVKPILNNFPIIEWFNARHPILEFSLNKQDKKIVALDIRLDEDDRILMISGPNAGGKSVCLKTVGLLQYMLQCGLLIPLDGQSEAGIFDMVFIDIGDKQSIEDDLSTYSSHIKNMADLLRNCNEKTLFLCDELGSGTEPQIGGAIAEAIVEELVAKQSFGIITTHYANLKLLPDKLPNIVNAAMLFDTESHKPLYVLNIGSPGSSFAMEMARNMGLSEKILKSAEAKVGTKHLDFEVQLQQLEVEKKNLAKRDKEIQVADELLDATIKKFKASNEKIENQRDTIINQAKKEAKNIIDSANKLIENTIAEIKKADAEKLKTKEIRQNFEVEKEKIIKENPVKSAKAKKPKEEESYDNLLLKLKSKFE